MPDFKNRSTRFAKGVGFCGLTALGIGGSVLFLAIGAAPPLIAVGIVGTLMCWEGTKAANRRMNSHFYFARHGREPVARIPVVPVPENGSNAAVLLALNALEPGASTIAAPAAPASELLEIKALNDGLPATEDEFLSYNLVDLTTAITCNEALEETITFTPGL